MTFREELKSVLNKYWDWRLYDDLGQDRLPPEEMDIDQALTSIINLVDKEVPSKKPVREDSPRRLVAGGDMPFNSTEVKNMGYNEALDDMRTIIRSSDEY
jgi:hypothetical protein